jgi:hypothetical protein
LPATTTEMAKGFTLYTVKAVFNGPLAISSISLE